MTPRNAIRLFSAMFVVFLLLALSSLQAADTFVFKAIDKRDTARDWKTEFKVSDTLHAALQKYELNPGTDSAIGVLKHFNEFYKMDSASRAKILGADNALFQSVDFMKYELVMQTRKRLAGNGAVASRRVGSSGAREAAIINWVKNGRAGDPPPMDPEKQFKSDDDVTNFVSERLAETNPTAHEEVNGSRAVDAYQAAVAEFGYKEAFHPGDAQTEFLSPTKAWAVIAAKEQLRPNEMPSFMFEWVRMNPEKYNNQYAVEMLEIWGYDKGWLTRDVSDPMNSTVAVKDVMPQKPLWPTSASEFAYIADNYRQIYEVHHGKFNSECKYLVRMIDAWEARSGSGSLPAGWEQIRATANNLYLNGIPGGDKPTGEAAVFRGEIANHISSVVQQAHEYHLDRVAAAIKDAMEKIGSKDAAKVTVDELIKAHPDLDAELNLLAVGYTNIPDDVRQKLLDQFRKRIRDGEASSDNADIYKSKVFTHIMAATQERASYSRAQTQAFVEVRKRMEARLDEHLKATNLDAFIEDVAKGKFTTPQYRLVGDDVRLVNRQMDPEGVLQDIKFIDAVSTLFRYDNQKYTQWVREYFDSGDPGASVRILRGMHELFDTSRTRPLYVKYKDSDGKEVTQQIHVSGTSLGAVLFKAAGKGADIFGQVQSGRDLYDRLVKLHQGGMSSQELGEAYATILNSYIGLHELVKKEKWFQFQGTNIIGQFALGSPGGISAGGSAGAEAARDLAWAAFKDIAAIWMPNVAIAIGLAEMTAWGWNQYAISSSRNQIVTAMLENGVWKPSTPEELKDLASGELPKLLGVLDKEGGSTNPVEILARLGFKMDLIESKTELTPRETMLDLAHDGGYIGNDPVITVDIDAVNTATGPWIQMFRVGALPASPRKWTQEGMKSLGLLFNRNEDSLIPSKSTDISVDPSIRSSWSSLWLWNADLPDTQLRVIGYIVSDFWAKRQIVMEQAMLPELVKEASRQWLDKLKSKTVTQGNYDFMKEIGLIDEKVKDIDKRLWPRIARSADPFPGSGYDPEKDTPILKVFQDETDQLRTELKRFEQFLKDPKQLTLDVRELRPPRGGRADIEPPGATKEQVAKLAATKLKQMSDAYYRYLDGYDQVHAVLDQGNQRVAEGSVKIEPFHLQLNPSGWALLAIGEGLSNPARGPIDAAKTWLGKYKKRREQIKKDVAEKAKKGPIPQSFLEWLLQDVDTSGSPSHPLWPELARLQYQIQKITLMQQFQADMEQSEAEQFIGRMTIKSGEPVPIEGLGSPEKRAETFTKTIEAMEAEYQRLLERLNNMFEISLEIKPLDPFIGQEAAAKGAPKFPNNQPKPNLGTHGFPDYVAKFRWSIRDARGGQIGDATETDKPEFNAVFRKVGLQIVKLEALDKGGNAVASETIGAIPKALTLSGSVGLADGDYEDQPIAITAAGAQRGEVTKLGSFGYEISVYDEAVWKGATASATTTIEGKSFSSNKSSIDFNPSAGVLRVQDELLFKLPYNVGVSVEVKDRAAEEVPSAKVTLIVSGNDKAEGRSATLKVEKSQTVAARVEFAPLSLIHDVPAVTFDPAKGREIKLKANLDMFDVNHLTVTGRFVPDASLSPPPRIAKGMFTSNIGQAYLADGGGFKFTNPRPIDMRPKPRLEANNVLVIDDKNKLYQPKSLPITAQIADKLLDLGSIEVAPSGVLVKPITGQLFDLTSAPLPPTDGQMLIAGVPAKNNGGIFEGEYTFEEWGQITIEGQYTLPGGRTVSDKKILRITDLGNWRNPTPPPKYEFKLPFYLPGNLHLTGSTKVEGVPPNQNPPSRATLQDAGHGIRQETGIDTSFDFTLTTPVRAGESFSLIATAAEAGQNYRGTGSSRAPDQPGPADFGEIVLRPDAGTSAAEEITRLIKGPPCDYAGALRRAQELLKANPADEWLKRNMGTLEELARREPDFRKAIEEGSKLLTEKDVNRAVTVLEAAFQSASSWNSLECYREAIRPLLEQATNLEKKIIELTKEASQWAGQCKFKEALDVVKKIEEISPKHPWLQKEAQELQKAQQSLEEARQLAAQAQALAAKPNADQAKVIDLARQAMDKAPGCAKAEIADLLKGIKLPTNIETSIILLMDTSGSMGDNNKMENAKQSATMAVQKMSSTTEVALIRYDGGCSGGWGVVVDFTTDPRALTAAISGLAPGGGTPMAPAIGFAINHMKSNAKGAKRQILLLTDGQNDCGNISTAGDAVRQSPIKVDAIGFGLQQGSQAQKDLGLVVGNGGKAYSAADGRELIHAFSRAFLLDSIKSAPVSAKLGPQASALRANFDRAQAFLKAEDFDGAAREYRQAINIKPDLSEAHYNLSITLEEQEQYLGAAEHARKYLDLEPNALDRGKVESRLTALQELQRQKPHAAFNPEDCAALYKWARAENETAKKKSPAERARVMEIMIAAQKGDCAAAQAAFEQYNSISRSVR